MRFHCPAQSSQNSWYFQYWAKTNYCDSKSKIMTLTWQLEEQALAQQALSRQSCPRQGRSTLRPPPPRCPARQSECEDNNKQTTNQPAKQQQYRCTAECDISSRDFSVSRLFSIFLEYRSRSRNFWSRKKVSVSVSKIFSLEKKSRYWSRKYLVSKKSIGIGLENIWSQKKVSVSVSKIFVSKKVSVTR